MKQLCAEVLERKQLIAVLGKIADAELGEKWVDKDGEEIYTETKNGDRIAAIKLLLAYGDGLPTQRLEHGGPDGVPLPTEIKLLMVNAGKP